MLNLKDVVHKMELGNEQWANDKKFHIRFIHSTHYGILRRCVSGLLGIRWRKRKHQIFTCITKFEFFWMFGWLELDYQSLVYTVRSSIEYIDQQDVFVSESWFFFCVLSIDTVNKRKTRWMKHLIHVNRAQPIWLFSAFAHN